MLQICLNILVQKVHIRPKATQCGEDTRIRTERDCRQAIAQHTDAIYRGSWNAEYRPRGCYLFRDKAYFNIHETGRAWRERYPVCKGTPLYTKTFKTETFGSAPNFRLRDVSKGIFRLPYIGYLYFTQYKQDIIS